MKTIIISDSHIGDIRFDNSQTISLLKTEQFDRLILNGDFIDFWSAGLKDLNDPLLRLVKKIAVKKEVFWAVGNHDYDALKIKDIIPNATVVESVEINEGGKKILVMHGHQVYTLENKDTYTKVLSKLNLFVYKFTGLDFQKYFNDWKWYFGYIRMKRVEVLEEYAGNANIFIIGHSHMTGYCKRNNIELFDIGSVVLTKSYGIIEDGSVRIVYILPNPSTNL